uniref:KIND domain-containing protein n=1 Tax=Amphilophus citrinellus TaxID=61819 RepID=A0A3Q0RWK2_AMPCI
ISNATCCSALGAGDVSRDLMEPQQLSLEEVLTSYKQPIDEEQALAVCYQCCSGLSVKDPSSILLHRDGAMLLQWEPHHDKETDGSPLPPTAEQTI